MRTKWMRWILVVCLVGLLTLPFTGSVLALESRGGDSVTIDKGEVIQDDLLVGGTTIVVDGVINGDLLAFGQDVTINGTVNGSVATAGRTLTLNGKVTGSLYAGGSSLVLGPNASVGRNAYFGGYALETQPGSVVQRDLLMGGYQAALNGAVGRDLRAALGALEARGKFGRDVTVDVGAPSASSPSYMPFSGAPGVVSLKPGIRVAAGSQIGGKLTYKSTVEQASGIAAKPEGGVAFQLTQPTGRAANRSTSGIMALLQWLLGRARELITLLLLGALAIWRFPALYDRVNAKLRSQPLPALGSGFVVTVVGYVGAFVAAGVLLALGILLLVITLGGLSGVVFGVGFSVWSAALAAFSFLVSFGSKLVVTYVVGERVARSLGPRAAESRTWALVIGVVMYVVLAGIPFVGWLVSVVVTFMGLGAMWFVYRESRGTTPAPAVVSPAAA